MDVAVKKKDHFISKKAKNASPLKSVTNCGVALGSIFMITKVSSQKLAVPILMQHHVAVWCTMGSN